MEILTTSLEEYRKGYRLIWQQYFPGLITRGAWRLLKAIRYEGQDEGVSSSVLQKELAHIYGMDRRTFLQLVRELETRKLIRAAASGPVGASTDGEHVPKSRPLTVLEPTDTLKEQYDRHSFDTANLVLKVFSKPIALPHEAFPQLRVAIADEMRTFFKSRDTLWEQTMTAIVEDRRNTTEKGKPLPSTRRRTALEKMRTYTYWEIAHATWSHRSKADVPLPTILKTISDDIADAPDTLKRRVTEMTRWGFFRRTRGRQYAVQLTDWATEHMLAHFHRSYSELERLSVTLRELQVSP